MQLQRQQFKDREGEVLRVGLKMVGGTCREREKAGGRLEGREAGRSREETDYCIRIPKYFGNMSFLPSSHWSEPSCPVIASLYRMNAKGG